jgi:hypothetical protein
MEPTPEQIEAWTEEWVSWLTAAAHKWDSLAVLETLRSAVRKSCVWLGFDCSRIEDDGIFTVYFGVDAGRIRNDGTDVRYIVDLINTEPDGVITAEIVGDGVHGDVVNLRRNYYIPAELRSNWVECGVIPEAERKVLANIIDVLDTDRSQAERLAAARRLMEERHEHTVMRSQIFRLSPQG